MKNIGNYTLHHGLKVTCPYFLEKKNRNCVVHLMASIRYQGGANEECDDPIFMILSVFVYPWVWRGKAGRAFSGFHIFFAPAQCQFPADLKSLRTAIEFLLPWSHSIAC